MNRTLAELRASFGLSQEKLARMAGVSASCIAKAEQQGRRPRRDTIMKIERALGLPPGGFDGPSSPGGDQEGSRGVAAPSPVRLRLSADESLAQAADSASDALFAAALASLTALEQALAPLSLPSDYPDLARLRRDLERTAR